MQLSSKFILLAIAFAYGGTAVSAVPAREPSVMARRSAEYEDLSAREFDDMELFVREPFSFFGFAGSSKKTPTSPGSDNSLPVAHTDAGLSVSPFRNFKKSKLSDKMLPYNRKQSPKPLLRHLPYTRQYTRKNPSLAYRRRKREVLATIPSQLWT
jgi:hypothetical protein